MTFSRASRQNNGVAIAFIRDRRNARAIALCRSALIGAALLAVQSNAAEPWQPFPPSTPTNDFGGVGLIQTPTARFAPDGQLTLGANHVQPYDRYFFTVQGMPWLEATLRLTTVRNRLYSPFPDFSGSQSYKDRGFDLKIRALEEGAWTPAVAFGLRDFLGTGLFSSEYFVLSKNVGPVDVSLGIGWGNLAARGFLPNPFRLLGDQFDSRGNTTVGGGALNSVYFKGRHTALFGGIKYDTPIEGLTLKAEYDSNDYQHEALNNRFRVSLPVNFGVDYALRSWVHVGAAFERGNKIGLNVALTTNFNRPFRIPKSDPPPVPLPMRESASDTAGAWALSAPEAEAISGEIQPLWTIRSDRPKQAEPLSDKVEGDRLAAALGDQGTGLYAADYRNNEVVLYVGQSRFANMATGLGRISRAAFSILPSRYQALRVVFVEGGVETISVLIYRSAFIEGLTVGRGSPEELLERTNFAIAPVQLSEANYQSSLVTGPPRFSYAVRPTLKTTLGRPEQFLLYQLGIRINGILQVRRGMNIQGSLALGLTDNFNKLRIPSNSELPHVRSDIKDYLREGKRSIPQLHGNYSFNIAPALYGHVYGGLLEEMFAGAGGEILYRPATSNWAIGADLTYVKQRDFDQLFDFRRYSTLTGFVTGAYYFPGPKLDLRVRLGRYLAKDYGGTFEIARTFDSGVVVGAFATKTNVSAERFGEGRFDKGIYVSIPLDALYSRHVRGSIGLSYRPLIRDGGQMLQIPQQLLFATDESTEAKFRRGWADIGK